ncbi:tellurite resistance TerB family protein [Vibrio phage BUCT194]|uniref:Tellurite resistance TerB family protein n=1 Tax=Vibrio phage BUCT194 TaxID=2859072 RepID=A0AAE8XF24_9CAUD|nr:tellurite resistance TerB family protein [Vibrio phage BUCT194]UAW01124.1 tellurite resistance TerB family protein [Vibrio phage BUCT194]
MKHLLRKTVNQAMMLVPGSIAPENQYAKSVAALLCLVVSADYEFEPNEFNSACNFIANDTFLREHGLTKRTVEYFRTYCNEIKKVMQTDSIDFPAVQLELIAEVRDVTDEYKEQLQLLINQLYPICAGKEIEVLNRINL